MSSKQRVRPSKALRIIDRSALDRVAGGNVPMVGVWTPWGTQYVPLERPPVAK